MGQSNRSKLISRVLMWLDRIIKLVAVILLIYLFISMLISGITLVQMIGVFACIGVLLPDE